MARSTEEIKATMTKPFMENPNIAAMYGFATGSVFEEKFSLVSFENFIFETITFAIFLFEQILGNHKTEVSTELRNQKSGRTAWYREMALKFQYGFELIPDTDQFINGDATPEQIEASKIIKYATANENDDESEKSRVILKIARESNSELAPITTEQREAFNEYLKEFRWAGVDVTVINYEPDHLFLNLKIYRDPLVIDENGTSIKNGNYPVEEAIQEFLKELPFNGEFVIAHFVDKLQKVEGVKIPHVVVIESSWIDPKVNDYGEPKPIDVRAIPVSGYYKVVNFDKISYVV